MDSTETARRLPGNDAAPRSYAELTSGYAGHPPIYAALIAEWEARGHAVPEHRDGQWVSFAAPAESETWTAVTSWAVGRHMGPVVPGGPRTAASPPAPAASHRPVTPHPATAPQEAAAAHPAAGRHPGQVGSAGTRPGSGRQSAAAMPVSGARLTSRPTPPAPR
ncbi:hypothetical protein [Streptomyces sp. WAC04114]|uniref:hypothetical protein n=1 Tax=Streptomyces sp. WAC04114 TaxID=2867961 RepID=UPI001C8B7A20|nr:hypothetical protein [Streptomyces sp. WAC04114]MBX9363173.1 hypothetical protein [Streptomyces sp. WAC04114]